MRCPHCNGRLTNESICPYCKNDLSEWRKYHAKRGAVNHLLLKDKHAQLTEYIDMLCSDKKRLERRIKAIDIELGKKEAELFETERELMK